MGVRAQPRVVHFHPASRGKPGHAVDFQAADLPRIEALMGTEPVFNTVVDPAMKVPEHRVHVGRKRVAQEVVFRSEPASRKVGRVSRQGSGCAIGRVAGHRSPAHVQPIMQAQFYFGTKLAQSQARQVGRVAVLRLPYLEVAVVGLGTFDIADPLGKGVIATGDPGRGHCKPIVVIEIADESLAVTHQFGLRQGKARPGR